MVSQLSANAISIPAGGMNQGKARKLSPRALEARRDLLRVHDLLMTGRKQSEIAAAMGKDPAWVSRTIRRIQQDPVLLYSSPNIQTVVQDQLASLDALIRVSLDHVGATHGSTKTGALRLAADLLKEKNSYLEKVGMLRPENLTGEKPLTPEQAFLRDIKEDFTLEDLCAIVDDLREEEEAKRSGVKQFPNRDDDRGAPPFHLRKNAARFARALLPPLSPQAEVQPP